MPETVIVVIALALAGFVHSATGFGSALVGMPLLAMALGTATAAPVLALSSQVVNFAVLWQYWRALHFGEAARLIAISILGIPAGLALLRYGNEAFITGLLGVVLIGYAGYAILLAPRLNARRPDAAEQRYENDSRRVRWGGAAAALIAGVLGGAYNANGPPLIVYGAIRRWPKERFKSMLQSFFIVNGLFIVAGHAAAGLITTSVLWHCTYSMPALLLGMGLGFVVDRRLDARRFRGVVLAMILVLGVALIVF